MQSVDDAFSVALAGKQVDVAPLGQTLAKTYLAKYEVDGATTIEPGVRDDAWTLYTPTTVLEDADKAAAIKEYVAHLGAGPAVDLRAPRRVRRGLLRRPRGALARGRAVRRRRARHSSPCRPPGTSSSPATRRPSTPSSRSRTRSRWRSRPSTTAATRRPSPTRVEGVMTTLTAPPARSPRPASRTYAGAAPARPGQLDPLRWTHRHRAAARGVGRRLGHRAARPAHPDRAVDRRRHGRHADRERPAPGEPGDLGHPRRARPRPRRRRRGRAGPDLGALPGR